MVIIYLLSMNLRYAGGEFIISITLDFLMTFFLTLEGLQQTHLSLTLYPSSS